MKHFTRRGFLGAAALSAASTSFAKPGVPFKLGIATYSLRKLSRDKAIEAVQTCKVQYVSVKSFHMDYDTPPAELAKARKQFNDAGITILSGGNVAMKEDTIDGLRRWFEYAKACGMPMMVCAPTNKNVHLVEKLVKEHNIKTAIHNHGPEDKEFPTPQSVLKAIRGMDPRVGLCVDVGHSTRTGVNIVSSIKETGSRLLDMHIKDLKNLSDKDSQCIVGEGAMPVKEILQTLKAMNYTGGVMLEYEIDADNPVPGMVKSFANMRRILAGLET